MRQISKPREVILHRVMDVSVRAIEARGLRDLQVGDEAAMVSEYGSMTILSPVRVAGLRQTKAGVTSVIYVDSPCAAVANHCGCSWFAASGKSQRAPAAKARLLTLTQADELFPNWRDA